MGEVCMSTSSNITRHHVQAINRQQAAAIEETTCEFVPFESGVLKDLSKSFNPTTRSATSWCKRCCRKALGRGSCFWRGGGAASPAWKVAEEPHGRPLEGLDGSPRPTED
ncbi:hypothetical protein ACOMHN_026361 [Nucella lapillus]